MSFYEDNVADGSHCGSCCQFIGADVGYARFCKSCEANHAPKKLKPLVSTDMKPVGGLTKSQRRRQQKKRAKARVANAVK
ncbi:hypothetical protein [Pseudomonas sp. 6D_7.1_Bac1]|uniref:hypothetical protein n=1 Tax=Pseudomonas sp. 6D_7.1_Bac1 TaxID=2971615 RepID=UPI0021C92F60|nr:hypothetical protein [Pseudomonas sp. 6D_7.1_Bac1]MCU1752179.1 hypothetical protein [Pseudomonas sp. 6D_7.1_Bac1]